jgi:hypothetical protein
VGKLISQKEEFSVRVSENSVLRRIVGPRGMMYKGSGEKKKIYIYNKKLSYLYSSPLSFR